MSILSAPPDNGPFKPSAPWHLAWLGEQVTAPPRSILKSWLAPPPSAIQSLSARGLDPRLRSATDDLALADAETLIALVPDLHGIVRQRVRGLAIVSSPGPDYDTSHSEPAWPGWIFVSIPASGVRGALRLAEGVIHEAMHHNLTALELQIPLTLSNDAIYSPWKQETRTASGILHGLYVFVCLAAYFRQICREQGSVGDAARSRITSILGEIDVIDRARLEAALSESGLRFCQALYDVAMLVRSNPG